MSEETSSPEWGRTFEIFHEALERGGEERAAWIAAQCRGDAALEREVLSLLEAHARDAGVLDEPKRLDPLLELDDERGIGDRVGPYRIVRRLGEGGMGVVFAADQEEPIRRQVALKLVKPGMDTREVLARFATERQALALMDHPNIATVHDAGATEAGRPFFVMELVDGAPITRYADERRLTTRDRLELFVPVCRAVQHAHQKGVIHRDLKPSNVLVVEKDGRPVPKVIDFGVAKATGSEDAPGATLTRAGRLLGTPEYMSPEQSDPNGVVDTRSDIYSLGVVLYELLAGVLPFPAERLRRASDEETRRILREEEPKSPSTRVTGRTPELVGIAERRGADVVTLQRQLRGELDWIVMKALEKDPARRYATASELGADVERYLEGLPVVAGPPGKLYQTRKFVGRHRIAVATLAVAFAALLAVAITFGVLLRRAEKEREHAETERKKAEQISSFLVDLFSLQDPVAMRGETVTPRQLLDQRAEKVVSQLGSQPDVQAALLDTLAKAYRNLGVYDRSVELLERSLEVRRREFGDEAVETAASRYQLGVVLSEVGRNPDAEAHLRRARELGLRDLGPSDPLTLSAALGLAGLLRSTGRFSDAEALMRETLQSVEGRDLGTVAMIVFQARGELATTLMRAGKFDEADAVFREALADPSASTDGVARSNLLNNYTAMLIERGDYARAEPLLREALALRRKLMGERHPRTISTLSNLALLVHQTGRFDEAELLYRENIERQREIFGARNRQVVSPLYNLALLQLDRGNPKAAEPVVREAMSIQIETTGEDHPDVAYQLTLLGRIENALGQVGEAEATLRKGLALRRAKLDPAHLEMASSLAALASLFTDTGRAAEAEPMLREAVAIRKKSLRAGDARTAEAESLLGACLTKLGRLDEAEPLVVEADAILAKGKPAQRAASAQRLEALRAAKK